MRMTFELDGAVICYESKVIIQTDWYFDALVKWWIVD